MNDDRKFQKRAEIMKELFLAHIPTDVIAKVAGVSSTTVTNDRIRVAKFYGINIPNAATTISERIVRFRLLFKTYLEVKFKTHAWRNPLYQAAKLLINFDRIDNHFSSLEKFWEGLQHPLFISDDPIAKNYQQLIEDCYSTEYLNFSSQFYKAIYNGIIPYDKISNEDDIINLATEFCCKVDRSCLNTMVIDNPISVVENLFTSLTERQITVLRCWYGLDGEKKTLNDIGEYLTLTKERVRQIREKSLGIIRNELVEKKYLIHSTARYQNLEDQYNELNKKYNEYCKKTDDEIFFLKMENARLNGIFKENDIKLDQCNYPAYIKVLIEPIRGNYNLPCRLINCLYHDYDFIIDAVEDWDNLKYLRNFGKKTYIAFDEYLKSRGLDRLKLTFEERLLARQLIKRKKEINS